MDVKPPQTLTGNWHRSETCAQSSCTQHLQNSSICVNFKAKMECKLTMCLQSFAEELFRGYPALETPDTRRFQLGHSKYVILHDWESGKLQRDVTSQSNHQCAFQSKPPDNVTWLLGIHRHKKEISTKIQSVELRSVDIDDAGQKTKKEWKLK